MQRNQSISTQKNRNLFVEEKKIVTRKEKKNAQSIDQWDIIIPKEFRAGKNDLITNNKQSQTKSLQQLLNEFVQTVLSQKYQPQIMHRLFSQAQSQSLSLLWRIEYTNWLQFTIVILQKMLKRSNTENKAKMSKFAEMVSQKVSELRSLENKDESNMKSENSENQEQGKGKKKKIKKPQQKKLTHFVKDNHQKQQSSLHNSASRKMQTSRIGQSYDIQSSQQTGLSHAIQEIENEISRVEDLYIQEMENIHTLPYLEVETKIQKEFKSSKPKNQKVDPQTFYPFQENINKVHTRVENGFQNRSFDDQSVQNYPLLNYQIQMEYAFNTINQQQNQLHQMASQHLKSMCIPFPGMNPTFIQQTDQFNRFSPQFINAPIAFSNGNYVEQSSYVMSQAKSERKSGNIKKKVKQMIELEQDDQVEKMN